MNQSRQYESVTSHMNQSRHIWISHVTYESVTSHMNQSRHIWINHATYESVTSHMNQSRHIWISHVTCVWDKSCYICLSRMSQTYYASHVWVISHITRHMYESFHILRVTCTYESFQILRVTSTNRFANSSAPNTQSRRGSVMSHMCASRDIWMSRMNMNAQYRVVKIHRMP